MLKKVKNSLLILMMISLVTGCVNQNQNNSKTSDITIAATSVAITQILDKLNVDAKQVVGIPETTAYKVPKKYQKATKLGTAMSPDSEVLSTLKPDLVISPNSLEGDLAKKYAKIGLNATFLNLKSVAGMYKSIEEIAPIVNRKKEAQKIVDEFVEYMSDFRKRHQDNASPRVLILMGLPGGSYLAASESSYVGDLVKLAGGTNIYGDGNGVDFINVSVEDMLKQNPDIILRTSHAMPEQVMANFKKEFSENVIWNQFDAVKNNRVFDLNNNYFGMSANFNYQKALVELEEILYA